jgi:hypothetical protein
MRVSETEDTMATMALPICELMPVVTDARAEARLVVSRTQSRVTSVRLTLQIHAQAIHLRGKFAHLTTKQGEFINQLVDRDFTSAGFAQIGDMATRIEDLVRDERRLLEDVNKLGADIRVWWGMYPSQLEAQADYLESISQDLRTECDPDASMLLATAVQVMQSAYESQQIAV